MHITDVPTEQTTAATDALLALVCCLGTGRLRRWRRIDPWKASVWAGMFGFVAVAATLGAVAHGLELEPAVHSLLWQFLNAALGQSVALFAVGAGDWRRPGASFQ